MDKKSEKKPEKKKSEFLEKLKKIDWKNADVKTLFQKNNGKPEVLKETATKFEINLVPEVKMKMIKSLKMRNLIIFACIVIAGVSAGIVAILGSVVTGQNVAMGNQDQRLELMSSKINSFEGLEEYLTIQDQLGNISTINENKKVLSRIFSFLTVMLPNEPDRITISELNIDLEDNTIDFTGQADAGVEPFIDYRVLEAFKKSVMLVKYDYGQYVDKDGNEIPTRCMVEANAEGQTLTEGKNIYAYWLKGKEGCEAARVARDLEIAELEDDEEMTEKEKDDEIEEVYKNYKGQVSENWYDKWLKENDLDRTKDEKLTKEQEASKQEALAQWQATLNEEERWVSDLETEGGVKKEDVNFEKVYRTPQFSKWYKEEKLDLSGTVSDVAHFESQCITYEGFEEDKTIRWTSQNECMLLDEDIEISNSSNGRDASGNLVLRFEAAAMMNEEALRFQNKHVMAISPSGRDVTDSYLQINGIFGEEAQDCNANDVVCVENKENTGESSNGGQ